MTSPVWDWTPYCTCVIGSGSDGTRESESCPGTIDWKVTGIGPFRKMVPKKLKP